jgi:hypothetical protein
MPQLRPTSSSVSSQEAIDSKPQEKIQLETGSILTIPGQQQKNPSKIVYAHLSPSVH